MEKTINKTTISFLKFCQQLHGFVILKNNKVIPKYVLYWSNINIKIVLKQEKGFTLLKRVKNE
jgi:hypothetical protein